VEPLRLAFLAALDDRAVAEPLRAELEALRQRIPPPARAEADIPVDVAGLTRLAEEGWEAVRAALAAERPG
jgi:hypothetical protein